MIQQGLAQARAQLESRRKNCIVQLRELTAAAQAGSLSPAQLEASREKLIANHKVMTALFLVQYLHTCVLIGYVIWYNERAKAFQLITVTLYQASCSSHLLFNTYHPISRSSKAYLENAREVVQVRSRALPSLFLSLPLLFPRAALFGVSVMQYLAQGRLEAKEITQHVHSRFVYEISSSERAFQVAVTSGESEQHHASMRVQRLQQEPVRPRSVTRQQAQRQAQRRIQSQAQTDVVVSSSSSPARTPVPSAPPLDDSDLQTTDENTPIVAASTDL